MARPTLRQQISALLDRFGTEIAQAFRESISEITSRITLRVLVDHLTEGDINGAIDALHLDRAAFAPLEDAISRAYQSGGTIQANGMPFLRDQAGARVVIRFDLRNPRAEAYLRDHSSQLVTSIITDQREGVRSELVKAMAEGQNPKTTGLDIVGRIDRATGQRSGGILGLTSQQSEYVASARAELLSGDPAQLRNYLQRTRRDKRFDPTVIKALRDGKAVPADIVASAASRYSDSLLKLRGETIGRTETLTSLNASAYEAFKQGLDKTNYTEADVVRTWDSAGDDRVRHSHTILDGNKVNGLDIPFVSPSGAMMRFPGDRSLGAGAAEIINCRCRLQYRIDPFGGLADG